MRRVLLLIVMSGGVSTILMGQSAAWGITAEVGQSWFAGGARRDSAGVDYFQQSPSRFTSLRFDRTGNRIGFAITLLYERTGLRNTTENVDFTFHDLVTLYSIRPEVSIRGFSIGAVRVDPHLGIPIEYWQISGEESRLRVGVLGGLTLVTPLGGSFALRLRWEGGLTGSIFEDSELPAAFEVKPSLHSRLGLGIRLGF